MIAALKAPLCAALRSSDYKQGTGLLCNINPDGKQWCCLGVAMDIASKLNLLPDGWSFEVTEDEAALVSRYGTEVVYVERAMIPEPVRNAIHLQVEDMWTLIHMNDGYGSRPKHDFNSIANFIENTI